MDSNVGSTSSTQSPPNPFNPPMAIATRIPPELLLDIFSLVSISPPKHYRQYLERNQNLKSFALVHWTWRSSAQELLQDEVYIRVPDGEMASDEELERIARRLIKSKVGGTKYLTVRGHLNELIAKTGYAMWSQVRHLELLTSSRIDGSTRISDFATFPRLRKIYLADSEGKDNLLCFDPSDVNLRFPYLRRITLVYGVTVGVLLRSGDVVEAKGQDLAGLLPITNKLFSPSNMPNLVHLALHGWNSTLPTYMIILAKVLPQITTLAIYCNDFDIANLFPENRILANLRHLSLVIHSSDLSSLFGHGQWNLQSLHLSNRSVARSGEVMSRLIRIAKGTDPKNRIGRIVIYGKRREIEASHKGSLNDLDVIQWREDQPCPPFEGFDGR